jgi:ABC-type protease/lipase transport system fused ATPase/permease subunit
MFKKINPSIFGLINGYQAFKIIFLTIIIKMMTIAVAFYSLQIFDKVFASSSMSTLFYLTIITIFLILITIFLTNYRYLLIETIYQKFCKNLKKKIKNNKSLILQKKLIEILLKIDNIFRTNVMILIIDIAISPIYLIVCYLFHPFLFVFSLFAVVLLFVWENFYHKKINKFQSQINLHNQQQIKLNECLNNNEIAVSQKNYNIATIKFYINNYSKNNEVINYYQLIYKLNIYNKNIRSIVMILATMFSSILVLINQISVGSVIAFAVILSKFLESFVNLSSTINNLKDLNNIILENNNINQQLNENKKINIFNIDKIIFEKIYHRDINFDNIIKIENIQINQNSSVAIFAKSIFEIEFMAKLITKIIVPKFGKIFINNHNIEDISCDELLEHINIIEENQQFYFDDIAKNIVNNYQNIDEKKLQSFLNSNIYGQEIMNLKNQYFTKISELNLQQKSLVSLLIALYRQSSILFVGNHQHFNNKNLFYDLIFNHRASIKFICNPNADFVKKCQYIINFNNGVADFKSIKELHILSLKNQTGEKNDI